MGDVAPNGRRVILDVKPDGGLEFMARTNDGGSMSFIAGASASFPVWLRLTLERQCLHRTDVDGRRNMDERWLRHDGDAVYLRRPDSR